MTHPAPRKVSNGVWEIAQTTMTDIETEQVERGDGTSYSVQHSELHIGGAPYLSARNKAVAALYPPVGELLLEAAGTRKENATALVVDSSGSVSAREGKLVWANGQLAFIKKGSAAKGFYLNEKFRPIEWAWGYNMQVALAHGWWEHDALVPQVREADFEGIPEYDANYSNYDEDGEEITPTMIHAVFLLDYPDFNGGRVAGCLFLATDVQTDDCEPGYEIANGYLWAPKESSLTPEHGSQYLKDLRRIGGRVVGFEPGRLTFRSCVMDEIPGTRREAYEFVMAKPEASS